MCALLPGSVERDVEYFRSSAKELRKWDRMPTISLESLPVHGVPENKQTALWSQIPALQHRTRGMTLVPPASLAIDSALIILTFTSTSLFITSKWMTSKFPSSTFHSFLYCSSEYLKSFQDIFFPDYWPLIHAQHIKHSTKRASFPQNSHHQLFLFLPLNQTENMGSSFTSPLIPYSSCSISFIMPLRSAFLLHFTTISLVQNLVTEYVLLQESQESPT